MNTEIRQLFSKLSDYSPEERRRRLSEERGVATIVRREVASLLDYDDGRSDTTIRARVASVTKQAIPFSQPVPRTNYGPYKVIRALGSGGMGSVYLAQRVDGEIEQTVAIKVLRSDADKPSWRERFLRERQLLASMNHPGIARLLDAGHSEDGRPWLALEYVQGISIDEFAEDLTVAEKLRLFVAVCDAVAYAHSQGVIHRDLKPSNILVDSDGNPRLLDFGIARILDDTAEPTQTVERMLTPSYASPEQISGGVQTVATDIYSLGAVLLKILTGRAPRSLPLESDIDETDHALNSLGLAREVRDILRKTLEPEPQARYSSVSELAGDVKAFMEGRPVKARSRTPVYRAAKFFLRYRALVLSAAAALLLTVVVVGMARQQRVIASQRADQVRQLTTRILMTEEVDSGLHNSSQSLRDIASISREYLETADPEARKHPRVAFEIAEAYSALARAEGICIASSASGRKQAVATLGKALEFLAPVLKAEPNNVPALLLAAKVHHDAMVRAASDRESAVVESESQVSAGYLAKVLALPGVTAKEFNSASEIFYEIALAEKNLGHTEHAIRNANLSLELAKKAPGSEMRASIALSIIADLLRRQGKVEAALPAIRHARLELEKVQFRNENDRRVAWSALLAREIRVMIRAADIGMVGRGEAQAALQALFHLLEDWSRNDGGDPWSRLLFAPAGVEIATAFATGDAHTALEMYDHALMRVQEVKDNVEARLGEAELLATSSSVLRRLGRYDEAQRRINAALQLLRQNDKDPDGAVPGEAADNVLRAQAEQLAATGQLKLAVEVYETLLRRIEFSKPDPRIKMQDAVALSSLYRALARLQHALGADERAVELTQLDRQLWQEWTQKLPDSRFVRQQTETQLRLRSSEFLAGARRPYSNRSIRRHS